ncbi:hypothetical protein AMTRI_Chr05g62970 [Amborella trichopoda]
MYLKRQLLEGNNDVLECIEECNNYKMPSSLRQLLEIILRYCEPTNNKELRNFAYNARIDDLKSMDIEDGIIEETLIAKPFLYRLISTTIRRKGKNALATASSGITATNFLGGTTTHSRIKIH